MIPFFDLYHPYVVDIAHHRYSDAVENCITLLSMSKQWSLASYESTSKGTPFYWMGIAAFHSHDFQTATFLFDAAVSEDLKHHPDDLTQPSLLTMQLKHDNRDQAAFAIVKSVADKIASIITNYNGRVKLQP